MATLTNIIEHRLMDYNGIPQFGDALGMAYMYGYIHCVSQAREAIFPSSTHYVFDLSGNVIHKYTAPFSPRGEANISTLGGKITILGGANATQDIWQFDPTIAGYTAASWTQLDTNFEPEIGRRFYAAGADGNGWFYIFGGANNNTVYKTQNFTSWTLVGNLPSPITRLCNCACFPFQGKIWLVGGVSNVTIEGRLAAGSIDAGDVDGYVYSFDPTTDTFTQVHQDKALFGSFWIDGAANSTAMYVSRGFISTAQLATYAPGSDARFFNNRGLLRSTDGLNWTSMPLIDGKAFFYESHRRGMIKAGESVFSLGGNAANDMWKITE